MLTLHAPTASPKKPFSAKNLKPTEDERRLLRVG
jgi:hypothetical protein